MYPLFRSLGDVCLKSRDGAAGLERRPPVGTRGALHRARRNAELPNGALPSVQFNEEDVPGFLSPRPDSGTPSAGLRPAVPTGGRRSKPYALLGVGGGVPSAGVRVPNDRALGRRPTL